MEQERKDSKPAYVAPMFLKFDCGQIPEFKNVTNRDWVYFGEKNLWPDYVINLYQRSAKHQAIISGKVNYIIGGGFKPSTNPWVEKVNPYESLKDLTQKLCYDLELFNGFAIEIIYGMSGGIVEMYHVDFSRIRTNKEETMYYYSEDWSQTNQEAKPEQTKFKEYTAFDFNAKKKNKGSQIYVYTIKTPRKTGEPNVYPIPEYMGALAAIETDVEISNFHLVNIKTGFSAGTMVSLLNGMPSPEEGKKLEKQFKEKFTGTDRAGSLILNFAIDKEHAAEVLHLQPSDMDKQYSQLSERVNQEIFTGHKVTSPTLFGVMTAGALGQRNEMLDAFELFHATYISPRQTIIEDTFNKLASLNSMPDDIEIMTSKPLSIGIPDSKIIEAITTDEAREFLGLEKLTKPQTTESEKVNEAINSLSPLVANNVLSAMTTNEIRALASLPPIAGGDIIPTQTAVTKTFRSQKDEEKLIQCFSECGVDKEKFEVIKRKKVKFHREVDSYKAEVEALQFIEKFREYSPNELKVLALLDEDNLMPVEEISKALNIEPKEANKILDRLVKDKAIKRNDTDIQGDEVEINKPTAKGAGVIDKTPGEILTFKVMYDYDWRAEVPAGERNTPDHPSRKFCKAIMNLNRLYSRADIEKISDNVGYNAWSHQGGFWNDGGDTKDHCRHQWTQVVVTKKG